RRISATKQNDVKIDFELASTHEIKTGRNTMAVEKAAIVTGAGTGIGRASAIALAKAGYAVGIVGRRKEPLEETAKLAGSGAKMLVLAHDVGKPDEVKALFAKAKQEFGRLDVLFNNAGMGTPAMPLEDLTYEQWSAV